jgi:putative hydrolase of the HAD superfamily
MKVICFDLDDTLCKEIEYLKSAYKEIAQFATQNKECSLEGKTLSQKAYEIMLRAYNNGKNAFEELNTFLGQQIPTSVYLNLYRNHRPNIFLLEDNKTTLSSLTAMGCTLGLITDGRSIQQRNKIIALDLLKWIEEENIIISEEFGSEKPCEKNFIYFMEKYQEAEFTYVGDNIKKDFISANALGWNTICLLNDGNNIHKQEFEKFDFEYQPKHCITSITELINLI